MSSAASTDAWRWLIAGEWRAFPVRFLVAALAIAIGVALAFAVHVINHSAADAFGAYGRNTSRWYEWSLRVISARLATRRGRPDDALAIADEIARSAAAPPAPGPRRWR